MLQHRPSGVSGVWRTGWRRAARMVAVAAVDVGLGPHTPAQRKRMRSMRAEEMAVPPLPPVARAPRGDLLSPVRALSMARDLPSVTPGSPSTPLSAGRLRMTSAI